MAAGTASQNDDKENKFWQHRKYSMNTHLESTLALTFFV